MASVDPNRSLVLGPWSDIQVEKPCRPREILNVQLMLPGRDSSLGVNRSHKHGGIPPVGPT